MAKDPRPIRLPDMVHRPEPSPARKEEIRHLGVERLADLPPAAKRVENDPNYQPWRVTTNHRTSQFCLYDDAIRIWFVRAPLPDMATRVAMESRKYLEEPYRPGLVMSDHTTAFGLDEPEWAGYWKFVKRRIAKYELVVMDPSRKVMDARCRAAWATNNPILFVYGALSHPLFFSATDFNPDADDDRGELSDIMHKRVS